MTKYISIYIYIYIYIYTYIYTGPWPETTYNLSYFHRDKKQVRWRSRLCGSSSTTWCSTASTVCTHDSHTTHILWMTSKLMPVCCHQALHQRDIARNRLQIRRSDMGCSRLGKNGILTWLSRRCAMKLLSFSSNGKVWVRGCELYLTLPTSAWQAISNNDRLSVRTSMLLKVDIYFWQLGRRQAGRTYAITKPSASCRHNIYCCFQSNTCSEETRLFPDSGAHKIIEQDVSWLRVTGHDPPSAEQWGHAEQRAQSWRAIDSAQSYSPSAGNLDHYTVALRPSRRLIGNLSINYLLWVTGILSDMVLGTIDLEDVSLRKRSVSATCIPRERIMSV
jgi:hypothetical protein